MSQLNVLHRPIEMLRLNNDSKIQMKLNIQRHRQKLLQCLENSNDTFLKPKIKSVSNNLEKITSNHNDHKVKPKIASSTEFLSSKLEPTKVTNHKTRSYVQKTLFKPVITTREKNLEVLKDVDTKKNKTRSSVTLNQLQPNIKVYKNKQANLNIQADLTISNVELKSTPIPTIENKDPTSPEPVIKTLKEQLLEELNSSSSLEDDYISVGSHEFSDTNSMSDVFDNDSSNSIPAGVDKHYEHEQPLDNERSKKDSPYYSCDSDIAQFDNNYRATRKKSLTSESKKPKRVFKSVQHRKLNNAKEREIRRRIAQRFDILRDCCSYLKTNRRIPSKHSILLAAKKECLLLKSLDKKLTEEEKLLRKVNVIFKKKLKDLTKQMTS